MARYTGPTNKLFRNYGVKDLSNSMKNLMEQANITGTTKNDGRSWIGIVEIKDIAREAGSRTKLSVWSNDENVDPVGSLVGKKGMRIQPIIDELNGEKIDVVPYSEDIASYIINAISPAPITVVVPDDALVFAIGAGGQNVRLAAKLTGWKIDIKTETQIKETVVEQKIGD